MRLESERILELGTDGNGIGLSAYNDIFGDSHFGRFILHVVIKYGVQGDGTGGAGRLHHGRRKRHGLFKDIVRSAAGNDAAGFLDAHIGDGIVGHGDLRPPVAGDGVDALVPYRGEGFHAGLGLELESIFSAGVGLVSEAGEGERQAELGLFAAELLPVGEGVAVGKPEDLEADSVGVSGLVVDFQIGHAIGLQLLGVEDGAFVAEECDHGAGGAGTVAEAGLHGAGDGFFAGQEHAVYAFGDSLVGRPQDKEAHLGTAFGLVAGVGIGFDGVEACGNAVKGDFEGLAGLCGTLADAFNHVIDVQGHLAAGVVANVQAEAENVLGHHCLLHAGLTPAPSVHGLVLEGEFTVGLILHADADGKAFADGETAAFFYGLAGGVDDLDGDVVPAGAGGGDKEFEGVVGTEDLAFLPGLLVGTDGDFGPGASDVVAAEALDAASDGHLVAFEVELLVVLDGDFEGGKDELVNPEGFAADVLLALLDLNGEPAVPEALGDGEFTAHRAVFIGPHALS